MEPPQPLRAVESEMKSHHPVRSLLLLDVLQDRESRPILIWTAGTLLLGTLVYHWLEGWGWLESIYFCVISLATIGYGDITPNTPLAKAFTIVYVINGVAILVGFFDRIRVVRMRTIGIRESGGKNDVTES